MDKSKYKQIGWEKSVLCRYYSAKIACPLGDRCVFAHEPVPDKIGLGDKKHILCRNVSVGCTFGETCVFAHSVDDVRINVKECKQSNCDRVKRISEVKYINVNEDRKCMYLHIGENINNFIERTTNRKYSVKTYSQICGELYLGGINDAFSPHFMNQASMAVLNVAKEIQRSPFCQVYMKIALEDMPEQSITQCLDETYDFIDIHLSKNYRVLVHCAAGKSRSASIVIAYLMRKKQWSFDQSLEYVKSKRPIVEPNAGFIKQLQEYQTRIIHKNLC